MWLQNFIQLIETASSIDHITNHLKIPKLHIFYFEKRISVDFDILKCCMDI